MEEFEPIAELQDEVDSSPEHKVGTVGTSPVTINRTDSKPCTSVHIHNPVLGDRANDFADVLYITTDGSDPETYGQTVIIGDAIEIAGNITNGNIKIASNNAGTNYEMILVG